MELHGEEIVFFSSYPAEETLRLAVKAILSVWTTGIVGDDEGRASVVGLHLNHAFVYKDEDALEGWNRLGWDPAHCERMIHLEVGDTNPAQLMILLENRELPELALIVERIRSATRLSSHPPPMEYR
jgi:hypothetical protein